MSTSLTQTGCCPGPAGGGGRRGEWPGGSARAACGLAGVKADKKEGDHASPAGTFPLLYGFYRPDRVTWPKTDLPMTGLQPNFGWGDAPDHPHPTLLVT